MKTIVLATLMTVSSLTAIAQEIDYSELTENVVYKGVEVSTADRVSQVTVYLVTRMKGDQGLGHMGLTACSGSLIASDIVLTAAHCVENLEKKEVSEAAELVVQYRALNSKKLVTAKIKRFATHPKYAGKAGPYDVAVVQLAKAIKDRRPVRLVQSGDYRDGDKVTVAGFGKNDRPERDINKDPVILKYAAEARKLPQTEAGAKRAVDLVGKMVARVNELREMDTLLLKTDMESTRYEFKEGTILLLKPNDTTVCEGDSGGPSFLKVSDQLLQVGVHSGGTAADCKLKNRSFFDKLFNKGDQEGLGVDVFVPLVRDWIRENVAKFQTQKDI